MSIRDMWYNGANENEKSVMNKLNKYNDLILNELDYYADSYASAVSEDDGYHRISDQGRAKGYLRALVHVGVITRAERKILMLRWISVSLKYLDQYKKAGA